MADDLSKTTPQTPSADPAAEARALRKERIAELTALLADEPKIRLTPKLVEQLIKVKRGNIRAIADVCGVTRQSVLEFINRRPALREAIEQAREGMTDNAETALDIAIAARQPWAVCFILKTYGRKRGYVTKTEHEVTGPDGQPFLYQEIEKSVLARMYGKAKAEPEIVGADLDSFRPGTEGAGDE